MRRPAPPREIPPPLELECLKALWSLGKGSVREIRAALASHQRDLAYTTVMTLLDRLENRGAVSRKKVSRMFVYEPLLNRDALRTIAVKHLVDTLFDGSSTDLAAYLASGS